MILDLLRHFQPDKHPGKILEVTLPWATFAGCWRDQGPDCSLSLQDCPFQNNSVSKSQKGETEYFKCCFSPGTEHTFVFSSVPSAQDIHNDINSSMTSILQTLRPSTSLQSCRKISAFHSSHYTEAGWVSCYHGRILSYQEKNLILSQGPWEGKGEFQRLSHLSNSIQPIFQTHKTQVKPIEVTLDNITAGTWSGCISNLILQWRGHFHSLVLSFFPSLLFKWQRVQSIQHSAGWDLL